MHIQDGRMDEFATRVKAMSKEELELVLEQIPVEMCLARIAKELERNKVFMTAIREAVVKAE